MTVVMTVVMAVMMTVVMTVVAAMITMRCVGYWPFSFRSKIRGRLAKPFRAYNVALKLIKLIKLIYDMYPLL